MIREEKAVKIRTREGREYDRVEKHAKKYQETLNCENGKETLQNV